MSLRRESVRDDHRASVSVQGELPWELLRESPLLLLMVSMMMLLMLWLMLLLLLETKGLRLESLHVFPDRPGGLRQDRPSVSVPNPSASSSSSSRTSEGGEESVLTLLLLPLQPLLQLHGVLAGTPVTLHFTPGQIAEGRRIVVRIVGRDTFLVPSVMMLTMINIPVTTPTTIMA